jgi:hypothetical protein
LGESKISITHFFRNNKKTKWRGMELSWQLGDEGPHHAVLASLSSQCDVDEEVEVGYDKEEKNVFDAHAFAREEGRTDAIDDIEANMEGDSADIQAAKNETEQQLGQQQPEAEAGADVEPHDGPLRCVECFAEFASLDEATATGLGHEPYCHLREHDGHTAADLQKQNKYAKLTAAERGRCIFFVFDVETNGPHRTYNRIFQICIHAYRHDGIFLEKCNKSRI